MKICKCGSGSVMMTPEVGICLNCDSVWTPEPTRGLPADMVNLLSASVAYESWFVSPTSVYSLDESGRGLDSEDSSISIKTMSEKLEFAVRGIVGLSLLKQMLTDARHTLDTEGKWMGSANDTGIKRVSTYAFVDPYSGIRNGKCETAATALDMGEGLPPIVCLSGPWFDNFNSDQVNLVIYDGAEYLDRMFGDDDLFLNADQSISWLFSHSANRCVWRLNHRSAPMFVGATQVDGSTMVVIEYWGGCGYEIHIPHDMDWIMNHFDPISDSPRFLGESMAMGPEFMMKKAIESAFFRITQPIDMSAVISPGGCTPTDFFVLCGKELCHTGVVYEDERGVGSGTVKMSDEMDGSMVRITKPIPGSTRAEVMKKIESKKDKNPDAYFESIRWRGLETPWSRIFDIRAMNLWSSREFWGMASCHPRTGPKSEILTKAFEKESPPIPAAIKALLA